MNNYNRFRIIKIAIIFSLLCNFLYGCHTYKNIVQVENNLGIDSNLENKYEFRKEKLENRIINTKQYREVIRYATYSYAYETVKFGVYEQDGNTENNKEPLEWLILDIEGEFAFLCSRYIIECEKYGELKGELLNNQISNWLNGEFYNNSFDDEEKRCIDSYRLSTYSIIANGNYVNKNYYSTCEKAIKDKNGLAKKGLFILDFEEWMKYLVINSYSKIGYNTTSTKYVENKYGPTTRYFLSSYADYEHERLHVISNELEFGLPLSTNVGILPAMWIKYK